MLSNIILCLMFLNGRREYRSKVFWFLLSLHTFMQILSPSVIKLWTGHRLRRKNNNNNNKGSKIRTGPLYYSIVGTVKTNTLNKNSVALTSFNSLIEN